MGQNFRKTVMLFLFIVFIAVAQCAIKINHHKSGHLFWQPVVQLHLYGLYNNNTNLLWVKVPISEVHRYARNYPWQHLIMILQFDVSKKVLRLPLLLNRMDPFPIRLLHQTLNANKSSFTTLPKEADGLYLCHYRSPPESQFPHGIFNLCNAQVSGTLFVTDGQTVIIEPMNYKRAGRYGFSHRFALLHNEDVSLPTDYSSLWQSKNASNSTQYESSQSSRQRRRRRKRRSTIQLSRKITHQVDLYLVVDYSFFSMFDDRTKDTDVRRFNTKNTVIRVLQLLNHVNRAYEQLGIVFIVVGLDILTSSTNTYWDHSESVAEQLIDGNKNYVQDNIVGSKVEYDCVHFIFGRESPLSGMKVGFANTKTMCSRYDCVGFSTDNKKRMAMETSIVMAHELGHNFGLQHDNDYEDCSRTCRVKKCIMFDSLYYVNYDFIWSQCSRNIMNDLLAVGLELCLQPRPYQTQMANQLTSTCGNGIVENTEQCDCGSDKVCNYCCDMTNCRFKKNAKCANGACCDVSTCQLYSASQLCRSLRNASSLNVGGGQCDLVEYCTGESEWCPPDLYKHDGTPCHVNNVQSYCFTGHCRSRETQCQLVWGQTALEAPFDCFRMNGMQTVSSERNSQMRRVVGCVPSMYTRHVDIASQFMEPCVNELDVMCGRLWCMHRNEKTLIYGRSHAHVTLPQQNGLRCHATAIDFSSATLSESDPGLVPDGVACGINKEKICINSTCKPINQILQDNCACNGHGVCNNLQQCYCDPGWRPPNCAEWDGCSGGYQHSIKSQCLGARNVLVRNIFLVLFFVVIPILALTGFCLVRNRDAVKRCYRSITFRRNSFSQNVFLKFKRRPAEGAASVIHKEGVTEPLQPSAEHPITIVNSSFLPHMNTSECANDATVDVRDRWRKNGRTAEVNVKYQNYASPHSTTAAVLDDKNPPRSRLDVSAPIFQSSTNRDLSRTPALNKSSIAVTTNKQTEEKFSLTATPTPKFQPTRPPPRPWPPIKT